MASVVAQTGAPLWRKSAVEAVGGWKVDSIVDEYDLYLQLLMAGCRFLYCPHVGAVYRRTSGKKIFCTVDDLRGVGAPPLAYQAGRGWYRSTATKIIISLGRSAHMGKASPLVQRGQVLLVALVTLARERA
jgi:hypothetical protein